MHQRRRPFVKPNLIPNQGADILDRYRQLRANVLYSIDEKKTIRQSHNNPDIIRLYKDYLGSPCGGVAEELLHTSYNASREAFPSVKAE